MPTTIRVDEHSHQVLRDLAQAQGVSITQLVAEMAEARRRQYLLEQFSEAYARLREDPEGWAEEMAERRLLENTLLDGLEDDDYPPL